MKLTEVNYKPICFFVIVNHIVAISGYVLIIVESDGF